MQGILKRPDCDLYDEVYRSRPGHFVYFERAAEFNRIVEEFLQ